MARLPAAPFVSADELANFTTDERWSGIVRGSALFGGLAHLMY
jgi:hypothetical protein